MTDEGNRLGGRLRRYAQVSGAVGGLAARLAGNRILGLELDRDRHAGDLKAALGGLRGPLMKVAQILATIPDALPDEYVEELKQLQANAPPMGWPFVRRRMQGELGPGWEAKFASFSREAVHAASLGQVHRAEDRDGRLLACKLQYPDMASAVEADLQQLRVIFSLYQRYDRAIRTDRIHEEIAARLREELDYRREAANMRLYGHMLANEAGVHVPEPIAALSTDRLLTMTWLAGRPILDFQEASQEQRDAIARNMFRAWYLPFYRYGVIHGDPHLGNYAVREDGSVNLLDYGAIRIFPASFVGGVIDLWRALRDGDEDLAVHAYETWGFKGLSREIIRVLNQWAEFVYAPLMEDRRRPIQEGSSTQYGAQVVSRVHGELRRLGGVAPPREFVMVDRAAVGLGSVFLRLKAELNWHREFMALIEDFDPAALEARQGEALRASGIGMS